MKYWFLIFSIVLLGCSGQPFSEKHDERVLLSLQEQVWQENPELLVTKCYDLSTQQAKALCYGMYVQAKMERGEEINKKICGRLGQSICEGGAFTGAVTSENAIK